MLLFQTYRRDVLQKQNGNFLLQALLALTLVIAFMPFIANKLAARNASAKMYSVKTSIETLHDVARVYLRENQDSEHCGTTTYCAGCENDLLTVLAPYGLPTGFNTTTAMGQNISLVITKKTTACGDDVDKIRADIVVDGGGLTNFQAAELARMIGFFARAASGVIYVNVPVDTVYSDIVSRRETDEQVGFLTELDMNWHSIENVGELHAESGDFYNARIDGLALMGGGARPDNNVFGMLKGTKFRFNKPAANSPALRVSADSLTVDDAEFQSVGMYDNYLNELNVSVGGNLGKTGGIGLGLLPTKLNESGEPDECGNLTVGAESQPVNLTIGGSFIANYATGIATDATIHNFLHVIGSRLVDSSGNNSGIRTKTLYTPKITFRNQTLAQLKSDPNSGVEAVIYPSGMSEFPDVWLWACPNGNCLLNKLVIVAHPEKASNGDTVNCTSALKEDLGLSGYSTINTSLMQNILCKYIYLERAERRINQVLCQAGNRQGCKNAHQ